MTTTGPSKTDLIQLFIDAVVNAGYANVRRGYLGKVTSAGQYVFDVPGRPHWCYVRVFRGDVETVSQAINMTVQKDPNIPVLVGTNIDGDPYVIGPMHSQAAEALAASEGAVAGPHTHRIGTGLEYLIEALRIEPGVIKPGSGTTIDILPCFYRWNGTDYYFSGGPLDISGYEPAASKHAWIKVGIDPVNNVAVAVKGTEYAYPTVSLMPDMLDDVTFSDYLPLGGVKYYNGQTSFTMRDFADCRLWVSGSGGSGASDSGLIVAQDGSLLAVSSNEITVTGSYHAVYSASPTDLNTINGGTDGQLLVLVPNTSGGAISVTSSYGSGGNIIIPAVNDRVLDSTGDAILLFYQSSIPAWIAINSVGNVVGPSLSTDHALARYHSTTGEVIQNSATTLDDSGNMAGVNSVLFNAISAPAHSEGLLFYDADRDTLIIYNAEADISMNIGEELYFPVWNDSGATITNGSIVYPTGFDVTSQLPTIGLADASDKNKCARVAMATHDIEDGTKGYVTRLGSVGDLNTAGLTGYIYLSATTPGAYTQNPPDDGSFRVCIGAVGNADASTGTIIVDPNVEQLAVEVTDTNGFPPDQRTGTTLSFVDGTRTFSINPTGSDFHFYQTGDKYTSTGDSVVIDNTEGLHAIYYDDGVLTSVVGYDDDDERDLILNKCIVSELYWDATNASAIWIGDERHGISMSPFTHYVLHSGLGTKYHSGLAISGLLPDENGSSDTHAQFGVEAGKIADEDLFLNIAAVASTTGLRIFYIDGAAAYMREAYEPGFSVLSDVTAGVGATGRLVWNENIGGAWQLTTVTDSKYVLYHVLATTGVAEEDKVFSVVGQNEYANVSSARAGAITEIDSILTKLPQVEVIPVATIIFQTKNTFTNSIKAAVASAADGDYVNWLVTDISQGATPTSHTNLSNLLWTSSGHTGTASKLAGFDATGAAAEYDIADDSALFIARRIQRRQL